MPTKVLRAKAYRHPVTEKIDYNASPALHAEHTSRGAWLRYPHLDLLSDKLAMMQYRPIRLMVFMPPRSGKSELVSHRTPAWFLKKFPARKVLLSSYESSFASHWGGQVRNTIEIDPDEYGFEISTDTKAKHNWTIKGYGGGMLTAGVGGPITGRGAHLFIIDDPVKNAEQANSPVDRQKKWDWYVTTARTRLEPGASVVLICTRWHEEDLAGRILKDSSEEWEVVSIPAIAEEEDPLGRELGEALWPERYPLGELEKLRIDQGPYWWAALYQQRPYAEAGGIIQLKWWQYHEDTPPCNTIIQSWDTAFKEGQTSDYSVCLTIGEHSTGYALLDMWRGRVAFPELKVMAQACYDKWRPRLVVVEDKASGQSLLQVLQRETNLPFVGRIPTGDKVTRVHGITGLIEAGRVTLPARAEWLQTFLDETKAFPTGSHDDIVDALEQGLDYLRGNVVDFGGLLGGESKESVFHDR